MRKVQVEEAVGMVLCQDIIAIVPGKFKGRAFKKGHVVRKEDIPKLLRLGKEHLYVREKKEGYLHEDEAAGRMARAVAGEGLTLTGPRDGKINLVAAFRGLLKVDVATLDGINDIEQVMIASLHTNTVVEKGTVVAETRVIPLVIDEKIIEQAEERCASGPVVQMKHFTGLRVGMIVAGSEAYKGRIEDKSGPVVKTKVEALGSTVFRRINVTYSTPVIVEAIGSLLADGADLIVITGDMSMDPGDLAPAGVVAAGGRIVSSRSPTLPGAIFMIAYIGTTPVLGLPVMYAKNTVFDLLLPRIMAGEIINAATSQPWATEAFAWSAKNADSRPVPSARHEAAKHNLPGVARGNHHGRPAFSAVI